MKRMFNQNPLPAVLFTVLLDALGFGILIPIIPQLLANPASPFYLLPSGASPSYGYALLGLLTAIFPLGIFFAAPIFGELSDRYGRKRLWALALLGASLGYTLFALGVVIRSILLLLVARAVAGITGGSIAIAQAAIADVTKPQDRAKNFGLIGAMFGTGFIIGPFLGGVLSDPSYVSWFSASIPFWFASAVSMLNFFVLIFFAPETHHVRHGGIGVNWMRSIRNILRVFEMRDLLPLFVSNFLYQSGFTFYISFFGVFLIDRFQFTQGSTGNFFAYVGLWIIVTQAIVTRVVARRFSEEKVVRTTMFVSGSAMLMFFFVGRPWELFLVAPFFAMANGLTFANITGLISRSAGPAIQGEVLGINASVQSLAQVFPPFLAGVIATLVTPETPIVIAALVIYGAAFFFTTVYVPHARHLRASG